jgi:hypothetical protein
MMTPELSRQYAALLAQYHEEISRECSTIEDRTASAERVEALVKQMAPLVRSKQDEQEAMAMQWAWYMKRVTR